MGFTVTWGANSIVNPTEEQFKAILMLWSEVSRFRIFRGGDGVQIPLQLLLCVHLADGTWSLSLANAQDLKNKDGTTRDIFATFGAWCEQSHIEIFRAIEEF